MKKVLVTGGAGFIGSNLAEALLHEASAVMVLDNLSTGKRENLPEVEFIEGDIRDLDLLQKLSKDVEVIFHQAALPSVPRSIDDPVTSNQHNIDGTLNVLVAARDNQVRRVVYAASSSAYGNADVEYKSEDLPAQPLSPYALTKYVGEEYLRIFNQIYGLETVALRYFNVFGPRQDPTSQYSAVIPKFITAMLKGEAPVINGDGSTSRDFTFVANNVRANILAATAPGAVGQVINIACGESVTLNQLVEGINHQLGTAIMPHYNPNRPGDIKHSKASIAKAKQLLGYEPTVSFQEGLQLTIDWYKG